MITTVIKQTCLSYYPNKPSQANLLDFAMSKPTWDNMAGMQAICLHLLQRGPIHTK
jgi:hypothetical protein